MKRTVLIVLLTVAALGVAFAAPSGQKTINFLGVWGGQEADVFNAMVKPFEERTGINVELESTRDLDAVITTRVEAGNPPDIAGLPGPGKLVELAQGGQLIELSKILDMKEFDKNYSSGWKNLGTVDGKLYGVFMKAAIKGLVWYNPVTFKDKGLPVPTNDWTWAQMMDLSKQAISKGLAPGR